MINYYENVDRNKYLSIIVSALFFAVISALLYVLASVMGYGVETVALLFLVSGVGTFAGYWWSDKIILTMSAAKPADPTQHRALYDVTQNLSRVAGLPMPKLYVLEDTAMNAFATGRDPQHAAVAITTGLLSRLDRSELEGVIGHELAHVKNFDIRLSAVVSVLVGLIALLADLFLRANSFGGRRSDRDSGSLQVVLLIIGVVLALLSPIVATLMQMAISRRREFYADAVSAQLTKYPDGLIRALRKLDQDREPLEVANKATANLYIVNPLRNQHNAIGWFAGLFNTHPPVEQRIRALEGQE